MYSVSVLLLLLHCFMLILVLLFCWVSRSSLYCNIPSDLCTLCLSFYYFYIVSSLYVYCCYVVYLDYHFTVISVLLLLLHCFIFTLVLLLCCVYRSSLYCNNRSDSCIVCVCLVITSTLFYLYSCTVAMLCIQIISLL